MHRPLPPIECRATATAVCFLVLMLLVAWNTSANAQEPANDAGPADEALQPAAQGEAAPAGEQAADASEESGQDESGQTAAVPSKKSLGALILDGSGFGVIFYVLLGIFSVVAVSVAMERLFNLRRDKVIPPGFAKELKDLAAREEETAESLRSLSESYPSPVANVLQAGAFRAGRPLPEVEKAMEDAAAKEMAELRSRHRPLAVIGNVAPLVGLLGTVVGMIFAFQISSQEGLGKAESLAEGIYLALMTTAAGLGIAIPCMLLSARFSGQVERYMRQLDECLLDALPGFTRMERITHVPQSRAAERETTSVVG